MTKPFIPRLTKEMLEPYIGMQITLHIPRGGLSLEITGELKGLFDVPDMADRFWIDTNTPLISIFTPDAMTWVSYNENNLAIQYVE